MKDMYEAGMPTAQRRRRRAVLLVLLALGALLLGTLLWGLLRPEKPAPSAPPTPSAGSSTASACPEPPAGITVDVYNATERAGLAGLTADTLRAQRFEVGQATNAPSGTVITSPAEIRYGPAGKVGATVLARRIRGVVLHEIPREGTTVDLVIGADFGAVQPPTTPPTC